MKFDYTKGKTARYMVSAYRWNGSDQYYLHYYKEAKQIFELMKTHESEDTIITIYDMKTDTCKDYRKIKREVKG